MRKTPSVFIAGFLAGVLASSAVFAWVSRNSLTADKPQSVRVLRLAHVLATTHPVHLGMEHMAKRAWELSGGRLSLEIFHSEQLGNETQCLEAVQAGTLAITKVSAGAIGSFVSVFKVFSLPYLFEDADHFWGILEGQVGHELLQLLETTDGGGPSGLRGLCFYDAGSRSFYTRDPVLRPEDIQGRKIRVMPDPVALDLIRAYGGAPTPIPWGELYTALQQRVVDGAENNPPSFFTSRHFEICRHFTINDHMRIPDVLVVSSAVWSRLSAAEQSWLRQAAEESSIFQRQLWGEQTTQMLDALKAEGVKIHEVKVEDFRRASRPVLDRHAVGRVGEFARRIQESR
jgi:tripartite ATP-independent transporter DctP family solute receptor